MAFINISTTNDNNALGPLGTSPLKPSLQTFIGELANG